MRTQRYDKKVDGGYFCTSSGCKKTYIHMYLDPCWRPIKKYGRPAPRLGLSPASARRNER